MITTVQKITTDEHFQMFTECYNREFGDNFLSADFLRGCEEVYLFFNSEGNAVAGYSINVHQPYRVLNVAPEVVAQHLRAKATGKITYELGTIWIEKSRRNGREKLELWLHIFGKMLSRSDTVMVGATESREIFHFYERYGMKIAYFGPLFVHGEQTSDAWVVYSDDISNSKVPEMYEALKKRLA